MTAAATPRRAMRDRVRIGQSWRRNRGGEIGVIRQIHRADRQVELLGIEGVRLVNFTDLRTKWTEVETVGPNQPTMPAAPSDTSSAAGTAATPPFTGTDGAAGTHFKRARRNFEHVAGASDLEFFSTHPINKEADGMPLPTSKQTREGRDPRDARILLVAPPKTGKTTLLADWAPDSTLILDTHQGTRLLDGEHYVQPITTFAEFEASVDDIVRGQHKFRTIGIDLIEDVYKLADRQAATSNNKVAAGLVEYGKGTAEAEGLFRRAMDKLLATPYGIWLLGHTETVQDGNAIQYIPKLDKRVRTYIEGVCEFNFIAEARGPVREIHTVPSARYQAGSRVPTLPAKLPLDARNLYVEIAKGLAKPKPAAAAAAPAPVQTQSQEAVAA